MKTVLNPTTKFRIGLTALFVLGAFFSIAPGWSNAQSTTTPTSTPASTATSSRATSTPATGQPSGSTCTFDRDLYEGVTGFDVGCLQQYLNDEVIRRWGSSTIETNGRFDANLKGIVTRWQQENGLPSTGYFGSMSRGKYQSLKGIMQRPQGAGVSQSPNAGAGSSMPNANANVNAQSNTARSLIISAYNEILAAQDAIDDSTGNTAQAEETLMESMESHLRVLSAYISKNYPTAITLAQQTIMLANSAVTEADTSSNNNDNDNDNDDNVTSQDAEGRIDEVRDMLSDARDDVEEADDDGDDIGDAEEFLDDAEALLYDADDAVDDNDDDEAMDFADEAEDLIDDALNEIE